MKHRKRILYGLVSAVVVAIIAVTACGSNESRIEQTALEIVEVEAIQDGDLQDPDHGNLYYDGYQFDAARLNTVRIEVETDSFTPLLKLMEVSTGAVLAEWDSQYSNSDALTYTIAADGAYEARVYSLDGGKGEYTLTVTQNHRSNRVE
ncbi:MAG: hypothetical protein B1H09_03445 [Gemmatimonadaceae bacterium 4484_173]|nr:MAG: hypothetical protein B1H09_03445 [Gemmatimonadaceae bacterium 4484_173]RKZ03256.1 MAG: hypothetical protein DRQ21_06320 [Candidatus Fermentibacteria bacterium]